VAGSAGLQPERTALAWQRTSVAGVAVAGSALVVAIRLGVPVAIVVTALSTGLSALAIGVAAVRGRAGGVVDSPWAQLLAVAAIPVVLAPAGLLLALLH
jgi:uncharacterized membrane protein YidH (DUF202 family)